MEFVDDEHEKNLIMQKVVEIYMNVGNMEQLHKLKK